MFYFQLYPVVHSVCWSVSCSLHRVGVNLYPTGYSVRMNICCSVLYNKHNMLYVNVYPVVYTLQCMYVHVDLCLTVYLCTYVIRMYPHLYVVC